MPETYPNTQIIFNEWNRTTTYHERNIPQKEKYKADDGRAKPNAPHKWLKLRESLFGVCKPLTWINGKRNQ